MGLTPKQERFCQAYIETGNASEAYRQAYAPKGKPATVNRSAKELLDNPKIATRLNALRAEMGSRHAVTVDSLIAELEEARQVGRRNARASAMVTATMGKAKLLGFDKEPDKPGDDDSPPPTKIVVEVRDARRPNADS